MSTLKVALDTVPDKIEGMIKDYKKELEEAWLKKDDKEDLTVTFTVKFSVAQGKNTCAIVMSFTPEKITDKTNFTWDDKQPSLPLKGGKSEKEKTDK